MVMVKLLTPMSLTRPVDCSASMAFEGGRERERERERRVKERVKVREGKA